MKKIVAALDGLRFSQSAMNYSIQIAKKCSAHLVGLFLDDHTYTSYKIYDLIHAKGGLIGAATKKFAKKDAKARATAAMNFERTCRENSLEYTMHHDRSIAIQELLHESIYADLLVIDAGETLSTYKEQMPSEFIRDLLSDTQCPVMVVPHIFKPIDKLILLYDGEPTSVHAIKMFSYTLAALKQFPVEVITVKPEKQSLHLPDNRLMKEFMKRHFPTAKYTVLKGIAEQQIMNYLKNQKGNPMVVLGAYRRGTVSRWFRASMADALMRDLKLPLFIAHNK
jgi:nucleotide-binding universal stress UspA family protein